MSAVLEDTGKLLGLSFEELNTLLLMLKKARTGSLTFIRGNIEIRFWIFSLFASDQPEISIEVETKEKNCSRTTKYVISKSLIVNDKSSLT